MKKSLAIILSLVMLLTVIPFAGLTASAATAEPEYKTVTFGSYPQSNVTDAETVSALGTYIPDLSWTDGSGGREYADIELGEAKYRAVTTGAAVDFYKFEPLVWRVLNEIEGIVICENVIENHSFDLLCNDWEMSGLRSFMNEEMLDAMFTAEERSAIAETTVDDNSSPDTLFLLSNDDLENYYYGITTSESRKACASDYAKQMGVISSNGAASWWTRSPIPVTGSLDECIVYTDGTIKSGPPNYLGYGVRPAMYIDRNSNLYYSLHTDADNDHACDDCGTAVYKRMTFGSYPQSIETDESVIGMLDAAGKDWISYGYIESQNTPGDFMQYCDIDLDGDGRNDYRGVIILQYRQPFLLDSLAKAPENTDQYLRGFILDTVYYFKYEPVFWRILDENTGLILSEFCIDAQPFSNYYYEGFADSDKTVPASDWCTSSLRKWLNEDFYDTVFSNEEKSHITLSHLTNQNYLETEIFPDSDDNIFLLSSNDLNNSLYGFDDDGQYDANVEALPTDYAYSQGLRKYIPGCYWISRTLGFDNGIYGANRDGIRTALIAHTYEIAYSGIRPALYYSAEVAEPQQYAKACAHNFSYVSAAESTCTDRGYDEYYVCPKCGELFDTNKTGIADIPYRGLGDHKDNDGDYYCDVCREPLPARVYADAVIILINRIPDPVTKNDEEAINTARETYDALSEEEKALVTNYDRLEAAEAAFAELTEETEPTEMSDNGGIALLLAIITTLLTLLFLFLRSTGMLPV